MKRLREISHSVLFILLCSTISATQLINDTVVNIKKAEALSVSKEKEQSLSFLSTVATVKSNTTDKAAIQDEDNLIDEPWSPENPVPLKYRDKKVQVFGLAPNKTTKEPLKVTENKRETKQIATKATASLKQGQISKNEVKASSAPVVKPIQILIEDAETEESESDGSNDSLSNLIILAETMEKPVNSSSPAAVESDSTEPFRELLDSLLNLPPSLLDQAAKSVESGQITPEALASLLRLRPDLLGESANKIDVKQITPDVIRSLLKLRMTFMQSGGDSSMFDKFAKGSPEDLVKLMKAMSPDSSSGKAKSKKKSKKQGQSETTTSSSLSALFGGVAGETEVKPTAEPAILPSLLTLVRPQLLDLIGLDQGKVKKPASPDRVKSQRFGLWKLPQNRHPPRYRPIYLPRRRRPSNPILRAVSKGLEGVSNHFQKKAKFVSNLGR